MSMPESDRIPPELALDHEPFDVDTLDGWMLDTSLTGEQLVQAFADDNPDDYSPEVAKVVAFSIGDDEVAEWAMSHVAAIDANVSMLVQQRDAYVARIERHHAAAVKRLAGRRAFLEAHLIGYASAFRARDPKRNKTLHLPSGVVKSTESRPVPEIAPDGDDAVVAWAREHYTGERLDELVKVTTRPMVGEIKKETRVAPVLVGWAATLSCGHTIVVAPATPDGEANAEPKAGDEWACDDCTDPIDGPTLHPVAEVEKLEEVKVVATTTGAPVPGLQVRPGGVSFKVDAR